MDARTAFRYELQKDKCLNIFYIFVEKINTLSLQELCSWSTTPGMGVPARGFIRILLQHCVYIIENTHFNGKLPLWRQTVEAVSMLVRHSLD